MTKVNMTEQEHEFVMNIRKYMKAKNELAKMRLSIIESCGELTGDSDIAKIFIDLTKLLDDNETYV